MPQENSSNPLLILTIVCTADFLPKLCDFLLSYGNAFFKGILYDGKGY